MGWGVGSRTAATYTGVPVGRGGGRSRCKAPNLVRRLVRSTSPLGLLACCAPRPTGTQALCEPGVGFGARRGGHEVTRACTPDCKERRPTVRSIKCALAPAISSTLGLWANCRVLAHWCARPERGLTTLCCAHWGPVGTTGFGVR